MRRGLTTLAIVIALGGLLVNVSPAQAPVTETIVTKGGFPAFIKTIQETRPNRFNPGDVRIESQALRDPTTNKQVGSERSVCTIHFGKVGKSRNMLCTEQIRITGRGALEVMGIIHLGRAPDELGIVGGTGEFNDVAGTVTRTAPPGSPGSPTVTIKLISH